MNNMNRRNGPWLKVVAVLLLIVMCGYFFYIHNNLNAKLKDTERVAERYRREQESLRTQLQGTEISYRCLHMVPFVFCAIIILL